MPDVPRDPRQLARDILSGKIRIEDLARERQLRGGGGAVPPKVPMQRPAQPPPPPRQVQPVPVRPIQRAPIQQAPTPVRPLQPARPLQRTQLQRPVQQRPVPAVPQQRRMEPARIPAATVSAYAPPSTATSEPVAPVRVQPSRASLTSLVKSKRGLRQGILLAEILGKPIALRDEP